MNLDVKAIRIELCQYVNGMERLKACRFDS